MELSKENQELWEEARRAWTLTADVMRRIIRAEAWKPKYETFTDAYKAELREVPLAPAVKAEVVYEMFRCGATDSEVADAVAGVGENAAFNVREQFNHDKPADRVSFTSRKNVSNTEPELRPAFPKFTPDEFADLKIMARDAGLTVDDYLVELFRVARDATRKSA